MAQLTIFYSGTVNVYDDVPADKAHAIMFLLNNPQRNGKCDNHGNDDDRIRRPSATLNPAPHVEKKQQIVCKRSQAELPFARKASLARFLEKRKDRVQAKLESSASGEDINSPVVKKAKFSSENETCQ